MSTYSEAWKNMDPDIRQFYVAWADINTLRCDHVEYDPVYGFWMQFFIRDELYPPPDIVPKYIYWMFRGIDLMIHNIKRQVYYTGSFDPNVVLLHIPDGSISGRLQPVYDETPISAFQEAPLTVPDYAYNYPRAKYKIRKSYWTGAPRRRRNL
jgi:hypothetical protein